MARSLNLSLSPELRNFVDAQAGDAGLFATPSEYLRDLIRRDMQEQALAGHVLRGLKDVKEGRFAEQSILDVLNED